MRTCFISATAGINIIKIREVLIKKDLNPIHPSEVPSFGLTIFEKISDLIRKSDLFIAILDDRLSNQNTFIELGIAIAHKKPILVISPPDINLPSDLSGILQVTSDFERTEAIRFAIDQLINAPKPKKPQRGRAAISGKPLGNKSNNFLDRLNSLGSKPRDIDLESIVYDILKASGISVITHPTSGHKRTDFAIWSEELGTILGNPILIEVKQSLKNEPAVKRVTNQTLNYLEKSNSRFALILYLDGLHPDAVQKIARNFQIIFLRIPELIISLKNKSFEYNIRTRRNLIAHGSI